MTDLHVGIAFGTCQIKAAKWNNQNGPVMIKLDDDQDNADGTMANAIQYSKTVSGVIDRVIGYDALKEADEENTIANLKYCLQKREWKKYIPILEKEVTDIEVLGEILKEIRIQAESSGMQMQSAVIAVPSEYSEYQYQKIAGAAKLAGFPETDILAESAAAVCGSHGLLHSFGKSSYVLVLDFGAAKMDASIVRAVCGKQKSIRVLSSGGVYYGGEDLNEDIFQKIFLKKYPEMQKMIDSGRESILRTELAGRIEVMKRQLCSWKSSMEKELLASGKMPDYIENLSLSRIELSSVLKEKQIGEKILCLIEEVIENGRISSGDITHILYAGGMCRSLYFRKLIELKLPSAAAVSMDDDEIFQMAPKGAVWYGKMKRDNEIAVSCFQMYDTGICGRNGEFQKLSGRNARYGVNNRSLKKAAWTDENGRINIYRMYAGEKQTEMKDSRHMIYAGYFKPGQKPYPEKKYYIELFWDYDGKQKANLYDGKKLVAEHADLEQGVNEI